MFKAFIIALQLLTRIPVPVIKTGTNDDISSGLSVLFYPLVGLVIGAVLVLISWLLSYLALSSPGLIEAGILLTTWVLITGALHLDGLADSADAWLGGYGDKVRTLEIMKDPYCGPSAVVVLILILLLKFTAIIVADWEVLLLAPVIGRTAAMLLLATTPYARQGGMGESAASQLSKTAVWMVSAVVFMLSIILFSNDYLLNISGMLIIFIIGYLLRRMMLQRIDGTTGDTAGALVELIETSTLLVFILLASF